MVVHLCLLELLLGVLGSEVALAAKKRRNTDRSGAEQLLVLRLNLVAVLVTEVASSAENSSVDCR